VYTAATASSNKIKLDRVSSEQLCGVIIRQPSGETVQVCNKWNTLGEEKGRTNAVQSMKSRKEWHLREQKKRTEGVQIAQKSSIDHKDYVYIERPYTECEDYKH